MKKWEYAYVPYERNHSPSEVCIEVSNTAMSDIRPSAGLFLDTFLKEAGECGWELAGTLLPFAPGKELCTEIDSEHDTSFVVKDALDIQWLIFKREK
jgi:hypothetical protein